jgi:hypothetical protein
MISSVSPYTASSVASAAGTSIFRVVGKGTDVEGCSAPKVVGHITKGRLVDSDAGAVAGGTFERTPVVEVGELVGAERWEALGVEQAVSPARPERVTVSQIERPHLLTS